MSVCWIKFLLAWRESTDGVFRFIRQVAWWTMASTHAQCIPTSVWNLVPEIPPVEWKWVWILFSRSIKSSLYSACTCRRTARVWSWLTVVLYIHFRSYTPQQAPGWRPLWSGCSAWWTDTCISYACTDSIQPVDPAARPIPGNMQWYSSAEVQWGVAAWLLVVLYDQAPARGPANCQSQGAVSQQFWPPKDCWLGSIGLRFPGPTTPVCNTCNQSADRVSGLYRRWLTAALLHSYIIVTVILFNRV